MKFEHVTSKIIQWHHDRNLIDGATDWTQTEKMMEELLELIASQLPGEYDPSDIAFTGNQIINDLLLKGRIKSVSAEDAAKAKLDALGDMAVVAINIAERNSSSLDTCMNLAWNEIKDRKGQMINGTFVKESDL